MQMALGIYSMAAVGIAAVAIAIYLVFYRYSINKQLQGENAKPRKLPSPLAFSIVTVIVVLVAYAGAAATLALTGHGGVKVPEEYRNATYDYWDYSPNEMTGHLSVYAMDENPGYTKAVEQKGDIKFSVFTRDKKSDIFHPAFIIYAEYTGNQEILHYGVEGAFYMPDGMVMLGSKGHGGSEFDTFLCVIGGATVPSTFALTVDLYEPGMFGKGEDMREYAAASETVTIDVP